MESFFDNLPVDTDIVSKEFQDYWPQTITTPGQPIQFEIPPSYTQLTESQVLVYVEGRITEADGGNLIAAAPVAPVNFFLQSLFKNLIIKMNGVTVYQSNALYAYKSYIENMYTYSEQGKAGLNCLELFSKETAGKFEAFDNNHPSYLWRRRRFATLDDDTQPKVKLAGRLHGDFFLQNRPLIPGVGMSVILEQTSDPFRIMSDTENKDQKFQLDKIFIRIYRINLNPNLLMNIERALVNQPAVYPLSRVNIRTGQIAANTTQINNFIVHNGQIPKYVLLTTVSSKNFTGDYLLNPYKFNVNKTTFCQLNSNGIVYPTKPYDVYRDGWIDPYINLLKILKKFYADSNIGIELDELQPEGYQILAFDLSDDSSGTSGNRHPPLRNGILNLDMNFLDGAIDEPHTLIIYMCFDSLLQIDARKAIVMNYIA